MVSKNFLSINNYFYRRGGAEVVFFDHNTLMQEEGWDVVPFSMQHPENLPSDWSEYFIDEIEYGRNLSPLEKVQQAGKIIYSFEARQKLSSLLDAAKPQIAHAHNVYHHISPAIFPILKKRGIPVVMTVHDLKLACPSYKMLRGGKVCEECKGGAIHNVVRYSCIKDSKLLSSLVYAETLIHRTLGLYNQHVDRFVVPSKFYLEKLVEWGWPRQKLVHIPNFVELEGGTHECSKKDYVLFAGRLAPEKGLDTLIRASAESGVKTLIAGSGPEEAALKSLAAKLSAPVEFLGFVEGAALFGLIGSARALALPSVWYENAPISVLEAYQCGTPVIGADIGGIPEMILDGSSGMVVTAGDVSAWGEALSRVKLAPDNDLKEMGKAGLALAKSQFSRREYRRKVLDLYGELMNNAG